MPAASRGPGAERGPALACEKKRFGAAMVKVQWRVLLPWVASR